MTDVDVSRRQLIGATAAMGASISSGDWRLWAAESEVHFDFIRQLDGWEIVTGKWASRRCQALYKVAERWSSVLQTTRST
jgi:hypothetical protein